MTVIYTVGHRLVHTDEWTQDNDNDFLTKWNGSDKKYLHNEEIWRENNNEDEWGDLECL